MKICVLKLENILRYSGHKLKIQNQPKFQMKTSNLIANAITKNLACNEQKYAPLRENASACCPSTFCHVSENHEKR